MGKLAPKKGPSAGEIARQQELAAQKEREKIALEQAQQESLTQQKLQQSYADKQSLRQSAASGILQDDETKRRKFLKGV